MNFGIVGFNFSFVGENIMLNMENGGIVFENFSEKLEDLGPN